MSQWIKTLTGCLCILTVLMHLVPKGKFSSYVRFYGGLLFFLVAAGPLWNFLAGEGELERLLQLSFLKDRYYDLESSMADMAELRNERIMEAYRAEITRQIGEIASAYGVAASDIRVTFGGEDGYEITGVAFRVGIDTPDGAAELARKEIAGVYALEQSRIRVERGAK